MKLTKPTLMLTLILLCATHASAQNSAPLVTAASEQAGPSDQTVEKMAAEIRFLRGKVEGLELQVAGQAEIIVLKDQQLGIKDKIITDQARAYEIRKSMEADVVELKASYERSLGLQADHIAKQDERIRKLEGQRKWYALGGAILGALGAIAIDQN